MSKITDILVHYPVLCSVAKNLTTLDLFHLASASKLTAKICRLRHASFDDLKRYTVCDGSGVRAKSIWDGCLLDSAYEHRDETILKKLATLIRVKMDYIGCFRMFSADHLFRSSQGKCLQMNPRLCSKCKVMVCETCRQADRLDMAPPDILTPGLRETYKAVTHYARLRCLCRACHGVVILQPVERIQRCNCMKADRWICLRCFGQETAEDKKQKHTSYYGVLPDREEADELCVCIVCGEKDKRHHHTVCSWCWNPV